jgi:triphosphatase
MAAAASPPAPGLQTPAAENPTGETPADTPPPAPEIPPQPVIELALASADIGRLLRSTILASHRDGRARTTPFQRIWHDTADHALRHDALALSEQAGTWRLERLTPASAAEWPPAGPAPILAEAATAAGLHRRFTPGFIASLVPVAAFTGTRRSMKLISNGRPARIDIFDGALRGVAQDQPASRIVFLGDGAAMASLASALASQIPLRVPHASLAAAAIAIAHGTCPPARQLGPPQIPRGQSVADALLLVVSHLAGVILYWASRVPAAAEAPGNPEPVHQMRVAVRRLRSALWVFRRAAAAPDAAQLFRALGKDLKDLASILGGARDWDVFLDGVGADIAACFAGDQRITALLAAAARKRQAAYAILNAHLGSESWQKVALQLGLLPVSRPWAPLPPSHPERDEFGELRPQPHDRDMLSAPAEAYASQALHRSLKRVTAAGDDLSALTPDAQHDARKNAKQLRYACEFFAPLFPGKAVRRFLEKLEDVQEALGAVNDSHVAASLMAQLGTGPDGRFASGVVLGFVAASTAPIGQRAGKAWRKLLQQPVFWD